MPTALINNQTLFYADSGGDGSPLVFLHGFLFDHTLFDQQVEHLAPTYRCIRVDTRGFGQTVWDEQPFDLYDIVADCVGLLDHLGLAKATFIGMSQGAYAALRLAVRHPERVQALVLMSTRKDILSEEFNQSYAAMRDAWVANGAIPGMLDSLMTVLIGPKDKTAAYWEAWRDRWEAMPGQNIQHTMNALLSREPLAEEKIKQVTHPVLSIHGLEDIGTPIALSDQLYALFPNGKGNVRVAGAAHAVNLTHAAEVNPPLKAFLDQYAVSSQ